MESISPSHNEGSISPTIPHSMMPFTSHMKQESTDPWNFQILNSSGMVQDNNPSFTTLESVHPNSSYASSVVQYIQCNNPSGPFNSFSNLQAIQDIHDNSSLHDSYRNEDIPFSARDEGLGSSPSSFNSSTPPLNPPAAAQEQQLEVISLESLSNYNCQRTNERSSSEDFGPAVLMNPPMVDVPFTCLSRRAGPGSDFQLRSFKVIPKRNDSAFEDMLAECGKCGIRVNVTWYGDHYLCEACCLDRTRQLSVPQTEDAQNDKKRKRSATVNKKENQICSNCKTTKTTLWRRSADGRPVCNACGLYEKLHKCERPVAMRKDVVQTRKRKPKATQSRQRKKSPSKAQQGFQRVQACPSNYQEQQQLPNYGSIQMKSVPVHANPVRHSAPLPSMNVNDAAIWCANYTLEMYNQNHPYLSVSPYEVMDEHDARLPFPNSTGS